MIQYPKFLNHLFRNECFMNSFKVFTLILVKVEGVFFWRMIECQHVECQIWDCHGRLIFWYYTDCTFIIVQLRLRLIVLYSCSIGINHCNLYFVFGLKYKYNWYYIKWSFVIDIFKWFSTIHFFQVAPISSETWYSPLSTTLRGRFYLLSFTPD